MAGAGVQLEPSDAGVGSRRVIRCKIAMDQCPVGSTLAGAEDTEDRRPTTSSLLKSSTRDATKAGIGKVCQDGKS